MDELLYIYTVKYYTAIKIDKQLLHTDASYNYNVK